MNHGLQQKTFQFRIFTRDVGWEISDEGWREIDADHLCRWKQLQKELSGREYELKGNRYIIEIDFSALIYDLNHRYVLMKRIYDNKDTTAVSEFNQDTMSLPAQVHVIGPPNSFQHYHSKTLLSMVFYQVFLAMNLSAPGSCNLYSTYIINHPVEISGIGTEIREEIGLHGRAFESTLYEADTYPWLKPGTLPLVSTYEWVERAVPAGIVVARDTPAKVLFALLNLTKSEIGPTSLIWVFYILETLFDCKPGENFTILASRIAILLDLEVPEATVLRKRLRELYDVRSAFVHGGLRVTHPIMDDYFDAEAEENLWRFIPLNDFGVSVIVCALQNIIQRGWRYPLFSEQLTGANL